MPNQDEDLYGDGDTMTAAPAEESPKEDAGEEPTFLVSKSALMGQVPEVGETKQIRAVRDLGDQLEFVCEPKDKPEDDGEDGEGMMAGPQGAESEYSDYE